jgi:ABC-type transport system substrate-binding protein
MRRYFPFLLLLSAFCFAGCARQSLPPDTLVIASKSDPSTLDPARAYDTTSINFARVIYNGLVDYDDNARIAPAVAERWTVSPDGKTYTFFLRPNVRFHSGRAVTADDVRFSLERVLDPETASDGLSFFQIIDGAEKWSAQDKTARRKSHVSGITVPDARTISIRLKQPDATFLNVLALPFGFIVPRAHVEALEKSGQSLSENPDGCGPFKFEKWTHDARLELLKNPDYYRAGLPRASRISLHIGGDETLHQMQFELGNLDVATEIPAPDFARLTRDPKWKSQIQHAPMMDVRYLCMNTELAPFTDIRVRRAFNYAIDKARLVQVQSGRVTPARGVLPPGLAAYNPKLRGYEYNPQKARELLKAAGATNLKLQLMAANIDNYDKVAQSIQQDLKAVGVQLTLKIVNYKELKTLAGQRKKVPLCILGWLQDYADAANYLDVMFNGKNITPAASLNRAFYSNPQVNALLDRAAVETDAARRTQMYREAEQKIIDDAPWGPLYHSERYIVTQPWVRGYKLHPAWSARYEFAEVTH